MFGWWKKTDDFEWREYVRTTILLKRKNRHDRVVEAKEKAVAGAKQAGQAGVAVGASGLAAVRTGIARAGRAVGRGSAAAIGWLGTQPRSLGAAIVPAVLAVGPLLTALQWKLKPSGRMLLTPAFRRALGYVGFTALVVAAAWLPGRGLAVETLIAAAIGGGALGLILLAKLIVGERVLPRAIGDRADEVLSRIGHVVPDISPRVVGGTVAVVIALFSGVLVWRAYEGGTLSAPSLAGLQLPGLAKPERLEGRASAVDGDALRVAGKIIQLEGIEAPERAQRCQRPGNRNWRCGDAARTALTRLVAGARTTCVVSGRAEDGRSLGVCEIDGKDVALLLVRGGHVFARPGLFAPYSAAEIEARDAKLGLWRGDAERPQTWRDKLWEAAKRTAPDGCPIKGRVVSGGKVYLLPWSPRYDRAKVRSSRGERWFCSEDEAREAGWRPSQDS